MSDGFEKTDMAKANDECRSRDAVIFDRCETCKQKVGLHCADCKLQVTGCLCTEVERFGKDVAWQNAVERYGEEVARQHYRNAGFFVPEVKTPDRLILPGDQ